MATRKRNRDIDRDVLEKIADLVDIGRRRGKKNLAAWVKTQLDQITDFEGRKPEPRKLQRIVRGMVQNIKDQPVHIRDRDKPFEWHRLAKYGLPWEAGEFLLKMWQFDLEFQAMLWRDHDWRNHRRPVTVRLARWWWWVHLAVSDAECLDVHIWAEEFTRRERYEVLLNRPRDVSGVEAYLAYRPWDGPEKFAVYERALSEGWIADLPNSWPEGNLEEQLKIEHRAKGDWLPAAGLNMYYRDILPSVQLLKYLEKDKEGVAFSRSGVAITKVTVVLDHGEGQPKEEVDLSTEQ